MTDQQIMSRAVNRYRSIHNILFNSELTMIYTTRYDLDIDLPATTVEKARIAKAMSLAEIERELTHTKQLWFSKRKVKCLLREKQMLLELTKDDGKEAPQGQ